MLTKEEKKYMEEHYYAGKYRYNNRYCVVLNRAEHPDGYNDSFMPGMIVGGFENGDPAFFKAVKDMHLDTWSRVKGQRKIDILALVCFPHLQEIA